MEWSLCSKHFTTNRCLAGMGSGVHKTGRVYTTVVKVSARETRIPILILGSFVILVSKTSVSSGINGDLNFCFIGLTED